MFEWLKDLYKRKEYLSECDSVPDHLVCLEDCVLESVKSLFVIKMSYQNYNSRVILLAKQNFALFDDVVKLVREMNVSAFYLKANRDRFRSEYCSLLRRAPFGRELRFPEDDLYVHVNNRNFERMIGCIMHALDLPDRMMEKGRDVDLTSVNDAKRNFNVNVDLLLQKLNSVDVTELCDVGVYCRETFESTYNLTWS